jgi:hypothetical protein
MRYRWFGGGKVYAVVDVVEAGDGKLKLPRKPYIRH